MPLPTDVLDAQFAEIREVDYDFAALQTPLATALTERDDAAAAVVTPLAELTDAQAAHVITLAAWVTAGSLGSGAEFDAKEATAATLATKQSTYDGVAATLVTEEAALASARADLAVPRSTIAAKAAKAVQLLIEAPGYKPGTESERIYDMFHVFALAILTDATAEEVAG